MHIRTRATPARLRGPVIAALTFAASLAVGDVALSWLCRDGRLFGRAVPPFGAITHPSQRAWLEQQHETLARNDAGAEEVELRTFDAELGWTRVNPAARERGLPEARPPGLYERIPPPGVLRIAGFGDSFTFGAEVRDHECWSYLLERALDDELGRVEVLNFGVGGFGTDQAWLRYRREGRRLGARVVLIGILLENVGRNVNRYRPLWFPDSNLCVTKPRFVLADGALELLPNPVRSRAELVAAVEDGSILSLTREHEYWAERPALGVLARSGLARLLAVPRARAERDVASLWRDTEAEPFQVTLAILEGFRREALADGAALACVLLFPRLEDLMALERGDRAWQAGLDRLSAGGVPHLDLSNALLAAGSSGGGLAALYGTVHLSPEGNAVAARAIAAFLEPLLAGLGR